MMTRSALALVIMSLAAASSPVAAQMDPAAVGLGQVMPAAIKAQGKSLAARRHGRPATSRMSLREGCANKARFRAILGAGDPQVQKFLRLCRRSGY